MSIQVNENIVKEALSKVHYPGSTKDVVKSGMIKRVDAKDGDVKVKLQLPTMVAHDAVQDRFVDEVRKTIEGVAGGANVEIDAEVKVIGLPPPGDKNRIPNVKNIIAVAAGKGGVGKSTVATNLAMSLKRWGAKVGLLDADIFGPSIPLMLGTPSRPVGGTADKRISPAMYHGIEVISVGFFMEKNDAVVWRGPMVHKLLTQFLEDVDWGELDYLILDMPPGTGDVQISLSQLIPISGALMVTTPQEVSVIDVVKGMTMFQKVEIPLLGVLENMASFVCPSCGHTEDIFGHGGGKGLAERFETKFLGQIPMHRDVRIGGDAGVPIVEGEPESPIAETFRNVAADVAGVLAAKVLSGPRRSAQLVTIR